MMRSRYPIFLALALIVSTLQWSHGIVHGASAPLVPQQLLQKARQQGSLRVIVKFNVAQDHAAEFESDLELASRRTSIAFARASLRATLSALPHRVIREFQDFPFLALSVIPQGLQALEALRGIVTEVVEDRLLPPFLAESAPLVQANQVWPGGSAGLNLDGTGTVIAVIDTAVDKNHSFLSGKVVSEACFSSNEVGVSATSVCPGGVETSTAPGSGIPWPG